MGIRISSRMIENFCGNRSHAKEFKNSMGFSDNAKLSLSLFEIRCHGKTFYCCWSGGYVKPDGEAFCTEVGAASLVALRDLPLGKNDQLFVRELKMGRMPLQEKVTNFLKECPDGSRICFLGDIQKELDGEMFAAFNVTSAIDFKDLLKQHIRQSMTNFKMQSKNKRKMRTMKKTPKKVFSSLRDWQNSIGKWKSRPEVESCGPQGGEEMVNLKEVRK
ncbi:MAG TPA: hypothetical protein VE954_41740 [Oligoflexus sp.]|uniref:hypothetical protein n=1 Tax=Oligoflexus sp. TaxID=1971216 RepID=UPI002D621824|nr:hypothetical protein [Oligoflexus sp.]HYX39665.1 hypothetical protein [Oligoflexus sp.]